MYDLIKINAVKIPDPKAGNITINYKNKYNEYAGEDGSTTIEEITQKMEGTVTYNGLFEADLMAIKNAVALVSDLTIYDPMEGTTRTFAALIDEGSATMKAYQNNVSAWSYSFNFREL